MDSLTTKNHRHDYVKDGNYNICKVCGKKILYVNEKGYGVRGDGKKYYVREHRMNWLRPKQYLGVMDLLKGKRAKDTMDVLGQTGARINEARHLEKYDYDDYIGQVTFRVTKTKAKKGERKGKPRTVPIGSAFGKRLKKMFDDDGKINLLANNSFNVAFKKAIEEYVNQNKSEKIDPKMFSAHSLRKTHGNWLRMLREEGMINVSESGICVRLGHDMNTYIRDYASSGQLSPEEVIIAKRILGDLYGKNN